MTSLIPPEAIINVNGQTYRFTIQKGLGDQWTDVTDLRDWKQFTSQVTDLFLSQLNRNKIDFGELVLKGDFSDIETAENLPEKKVSFVTAKVRADGQEYAYDARQIKNLQPQQKAAIKNRLNNIGREFANIRKISSQPIIPPAGSAPLAAQHNPAPSSLRVIPASVRTVEIDASGQCLDSSLAYQMLSKENHGPFDLNGDRALLQQRADGLRTSVAQFMHDHPELDADSEFVGNLAASIQNIPLLPPQIQAILRNRLHEATISSTEDMRRTAEQNRIHLREFYANYITARDTSGKMCNYLDSAFLDILSRIPLSSELQPHYQPHHQLRFAIVQGNSIKSKYPPSSELNENNCLFINYNGVDHYQAVDMSDRFSKDTISLMVKNHKVAVVNDFIELISEASATDGEIIRQRLQHEVKIQYPQAYNAIAQLIYEYDLENWERGDKLFAKPGTSEEIDWNTQIVYPGDRYGDFRIDATPPDELKVMLQLLRQRIAAQVAAL
jgi:hypothetical protein